MNSLLKKGTILLFVWFLISACDLLAISKPSTVESPVLSPKGGTFQDDVEVSISSPGNGKIFWKKGRSSQWLLYETPILVRSSEEIEARIVNGSLFSGIVKEVYKISHLEKVKTPIVETDKNYFFDTKQITINCTTADAKIEYRLNESPWTRYEGPFDISETSTIVLRGSKEGMTNSSVSDSMNLLKIELPSNGLITIATYNVENFDLGGYSSEQYDNIANFVKEQKLEVIVLEEIQTNDGDISEFNAALESVGYSMPFSEKTSMSDNDNAIGVWSRLPIENKSEILDPPGPRSILRFKIDVNGNDFWVYGAHLKSGPDIKSFGKRKKQAKELADYVINNHDEHNDNIIFLGDMNTMGYDGGSNEDFDLDSTMDILQLKTDSDFLNDFYAVNYNELDKRVHYTNPGWDSLLDHIILSPAAQKRYKANSVRVPHPRGDGKYGPSDHYPVVIDLAF